MTFSQKWEELKQRELEADLRRQVKEEVSEGLDIQDLLNRDIQETVDKTRRMLLQKYGLMPPQPISKRQMHSMARRWREKNEF